jgi:hypothetical protein
LPISTFLSASLLLLGELVRRASGKAVDRHGAVASGKGRRGGRLARKSPSRTALARLLAAMKAGANSAPNTKRIVLR